MARDTSIRTYRQLRAEGKVTEGQDKVYEAITVLDKPNDREISNHIGMEKSSQTARRNELYEMGVIRESGKRKCKITNRLTQTWEIVPDDEVQVKHRGPICPTCNGKGRLDQCPVCEGKGVIKEDLGHGFNTVIPCPDCSSS